MEGDGTDVRRRERRQENKERRWIEWKEGELHLFHVFSYAAPFRMMSFRLMTFYFRTTTGEASTHTNTRAQRSTITMRRAARKAVSRENIDSLRK